MPPTITTLPAAIQDREQDLEQGFNLDIRVAAVDTPFPLRGPATATGGCCSAARSCITCSTEDVQSW